MALGRRQRGDQFGAALLQIGRSGQGESLRSSGIVRNASHDVTLLRFHLAHKGSGPAFPQNLSYCALSYERVIMKESSCGASCLRENSALTCCFYVGQNFSPDPNEPQRAFSPLGHAFMLDLPESRSHTSGPDARCGEIGQNVKSSYAWAEAQAYLEPRIASSYAQTKGGAIVGSPRLLTAAQGERKDPISKQRLWRTVPVAGEILSQKHW